MLAQSRKHGKVLESCRVAGERDAHRDLLEQAAHDLAAARLGKRVGETDLPETRRRLLDRTLFEREVFAEGP